MKKIVVSLLMFLIIVSSTPIGLFSVNAVTQSGSTGDCTWKLDGTKLTISGKGRMTDYTEKVDKGDYFDIGYEELPWGTEITDLYLTEGVTYIGAASFYLCNKLKNVSLPKSLEYINNEAFYGCENLKNVYINDIKSWCNICFSGFNSNPLYYAENLYLNKKIVKEIVIPDGITKINSYAFMYKNLNKITLPNTIKEIGNSSFKNCTNLSSINIPVKVTKIEESTFENCNKLAKIEIPKKVTSIGDKAFLNCDKLSEISIPETVAYLAPSSFVSCDTLKSINVHKNNKSYCSENGIVYNKNMTEILICPSGKNTDVIIPNSVKQLSMSSVMEIAMGHGYGAFYYCRNIKNLVIPNSVELKTCEFRFCTAKCIILCDGFKKISYSCFASNSSNMFIPKSVALIEEGVFRYDLIKEVWYAGNKKDRDKIIIEDRNEGLLSAKWHYNTCAYDKHYYSNEIDTTCNKCEWVREICKHKYTNNCDTKCNVCNAKRTIKHTYKTVVGTKATLTKNGKTVKKCSGCGWVATGSAVTVKYPKTIKLSATTYTYNGKVKTPTVTVKDSAGKTLKKNTDYTVTYPSGRKNVGTYKVKVTFKGKYSGTKYLAFKINPISISKCKLSLSTTSYTYSGKVKTPTVTVKNSSGTKLTKNSSYTVTYASGRKNVGKYKVTVKMKGNYTGTKTLYFTINPVKTTVSKLAAGKKSIKVTVGKKTAQVTGYQIQYSTSKKFTSPKTKNITSYKTTSTTLTKLTSKKTYYVRVRTYKTVSGKKYYSGWSTYKYTKAK